MLVALLVAIVAVAIGVGIGLARSSAHRTLGPIRTFALVAAFATVVIELLPRAVAGGGLLALAIFAAAAALPWVAERLGARAGSDRSAAWRLEIGYVGLLVHHVGDGLGLGTFTGGAHSGHTHWDVLLAIGGHTVPVTAVVVLAYGRRASARVAALRGGLFAVAIAVGIALAESVPDAPFAAVEPYLTAAVAGLLLHVATHDWLEDPPPTTGARVVDLAAAIVGVLIVASAGAAHEHEHGALEPEEIHAVALRLLCRYAPALLAATVLGALLARSSPPRPSRRSTFLAAVMGATTGGGADRGMALADARADRDRRTSIAFAMGSAGIGLETIAALSTAFGPAFAGSWALLSALVIGITARLSARAPAKHEHEHEHEHDERAPLAPARPAAPARVERGAWASLETSFGRVGAPALLGLAVAAVLELGLRDGALAPLARWRIDVLILPLVALAVALPPLAWVPPLLVLVDKGAYAPAALVAVAVAASNRPAVVAWAKLALHARVAGWAFAIGSGALLSYLRWPPSPVRERAQALDPVGLVCAAALGAFMLAGLLRRGVRPWLALGVGSTNHDHGPCFEESARVTPLPKAAAPSPAD